MHSIKRLWHVKEKLQIAKSGWFIVFSEWTSESAIELSFDCDVTENFLRVIRKLSTADAFMTLLNFWRAERKEYWNKSSSSSEQKK